MSVANVQNPLTSALRTVGRPLNTGTQGAGAQGPAAAPTQPAALRPQQPLAAAAPSLPPEPPPGTDPALWSVLTGEERAYFAKASATGPLTYSRISAGVTALRGGGAPPAALQGASIGGRLDVRA
jgi:hypothetical protein